MPSSGLFRVFSSPHDHACIFFFLPLLKQKHSSHTSKSNSKVTSTGKHPPALIGPFSQPLLSWASVSITVLCLSVWAAQSYHSLAMWPWTSYLTPLSLSSLFVKWCRYIVRIKWVNPCKFKTVPGTSQVLRFHYNYEFAYPSVCLFDSELLGIKDNTMSNT